jgi:predicted  nucleic acid-binding Zn-ribbon protein
MQSHPTAPTEGILQMEERIQTAVLAKMHTPMEQDDVPDRVHALEGQVQQLLVKQQGLENQLQEFNGHHTQQLASLQTQVTAQSQQIHGHLENQNQTIQSLFEQQMTQIRTLLAKRPREDTNE